MDRLSKGARRCVLFSGFSAGWRARWRARDRVGVLAVTGAEAGPALRAGVAVRATRSGRGPATVLAPPSDEQLDRAAAQGAALALDMLSQEVCSDGTVPRNLRQQARLREPVKAAPSAHKPARRACRCRGGDIEFAITGAWLLAGAASSSTPTIAWWRPLQSWLGSRSMSLARRARKNAEPGSQRLRGCVHACTVRRNP
jgi:hypothetical protein